MVINPFLIFIFLVFLNRKKQAAKKSLLGRYGLLSFYQRHSLIRTAVLRPHDGPDLVHGGGAEIIGGLPVPVGSAPPS